MTSIAEEMKKMETSRCSPPPMPTNEELIALHAKIARQTSNAQNERVFEAFGKTYERMSVMEKSFVQHHEMQEAMTYLANQIAKRPEPMQVDANRMKCPKMHWWRSKRIFLTWKATFMH